jgi:tungstate transport system permease protein
VAYLWGQFSAAMSLIVHGDPYLYGLLWTTIKVAAISTSAALAIGLPIGLTIGLGRFRGRGALQLLANASLALPPVVLGIGVLLLVLPPGVLGPWHAADTLKAVYLVQAVLALPYIVALVPAAIQGLPAGLLEQARALGATRLQLAALALREARIGVLAAVIAALGATISEVGAVIVVGGSIQGHDQTLASALLTQFTQGPDDPPETAIAIVLMALILVLMGVLTIVQQRTEGIHMRFRGA